MPLDVRSILTGWYWEETWKSFQGTCNTGYCSHSAATTITTYAQ